MANAPHQFSFLGSAWWPRLFLGIFISNICACARVSAISNNDIAPTVATLDRTGQLLALSLPRVDPLGPLSQREINEPVHARHAGELVFTQKRLESSSTPLDDADLDHTFVLGSMIWMRAYFRESIENSMRRAGVECHGDPTTALWLTKPFRTTRPWLESRVQFTAVQ